jgi:hypothetical protein
VVIVSTGNYGYEAVIFLNSQFGPSGYFQLAVSISKLSLESGLVGIYRIWRKEFEPELSIFEIGKCRKSFVCFPVSQVIVFAQVASL